MSTHPSDALRHVSKHQNRAFSTQSVERPGTTRSVAPDRTFLIFTVSEKITKDQVIRQREDTNRCNDTRCGYRKAGRTNALPAALLPLLRVNFTAPAAFSGFAPPCRPAIGKCRSPNWPSGRNCPARPTLPIGRRAVAGHSPGSSPPAPADCRSLR